MSTWRIANAEGLRGTVEIDDVTTRQDGSLVGLREVGRSRPVRLEGVFVLARGHWQAAWVDGAEILWDTPPPETVQEQDIPRAAPARARILEQLTDSELAEARRQAIADRLAGIGGTEDDS